MNDRELGNYLLTCSGNSWLCDIGGSYLFAFLPENNQVNKSEREPVCQPLQFTAWHIDKAADDL